ncbi:MAG: gamma-glutamyltransferase [Bacteroidota bacterium]
MKILRGLIYGGFLFLWLFGHHSVAVAQAGWTKKYDNGLVVSAEERASHIGIDILKKGGNAIDAAVAVQFALAVTLPRAGNIGGGGFMVIHLADGTTTALDYREKAPLSSTRDMYVKNGTFQSDLSWEGILSVGVPGTVDGMIKALERYGALPLETVIEPAIELARSGYKLSYSQATDMARYADRFQKYVGSRSYFLKNDSTVYQEGDVFIQTDLAETLEQIARFGRDGFYSGPVADAIVKEMEQSGGLISLRDLQRYQSVWRTPVSTDFGAYTLHAMPPPSSGGIAVTQILEMMEPYRPDTLGHHSAAYIHVLSEAMRRAFSDRSYYLGDPDFWEIPQQALLSEAYLNDRMASFSADQATLSSSLSHGEVYLVNESSETTHYSVVDAMGNAVAVTTTLNNSFGSMVAVSGAGFLLNNEMDDFSAQPGAPNSYGLIGGEANAIQPEKRMLSSMTPIIVTRNDSVSMVLGAAGGPRIITATLQNFLNIALFGMNAQQAVSAPRIHHQWLPDRLYYEYFGLSADTINLLRQKGHQLQTRGYIGRSHIINVKNGQLTSGTDPRGDGFAAGY